MHKNLKILKLCKMLQNASKPVFLNSSEGVKLPSDRFPILIKLIFNSDKFSAAFGAEFYIRFWREISREIFQ